LGGDNVVLQEKLIYIAGIIKNDHLTMFKRQIVRQTRGNCCLYITPVELTPEHILLRDNFHEKRNIFVIVVNATVQGNLSAKMSKICSSMAEHVK